MFRLHRKDLIEVWEDIVSIKELVIALIVNSFTTMGGYFLAPNDPPKPLLFGLIGAMIGFSLCTILIRPKRIFEEEERGE
ncbi:hypothetical protein BpJC7_19550 [Weizmannia acidilactici]|uniref:Uncharacterized protein n=1 Tax=Weizmannia acidilactici TaxID=2607726 RepID=A0A5J4J6V6_9BACI|nr:hypothetical protein [Weizmannia acidilactici]GER66652.1 hypothetical protein BpJC4_11230 [Weizmannia acidilactici]GER70652.1 hypothetical protein BpJC7_19550 [Weizmannia acidilactici]GER72812.1 hypothetical protein BpPP18_08790 [Weizmannia acidilactici]